MSQAQPQSHTRRGELPLADRTMELRAFRRAAPAEGDDPAATDAPLATAELVFTTGAGVKRYDWANDRYFIEELVVDASAVRMDRLRAGAPLLNTHDNWDLEAVLGVVDSPAIEGGAGTCSVTFSRRESVAGYVQDVADGVIRNVSVGYVRHAMEMVAPSDENAMWRYRVTDWEPYEVSLVPIPADAGAQVRSDGQPGASRDTRTFPCQITTRAAGSPSSPNGGRSAATSSQGASMKDDAAGGTNAPANQTTNVTATGGEIAEVQRQAAEAERQRASAITELCARHNVPQLARKLIDENQSVDQARAAVLNELAVRDAGRGGHLNVLRIETVSDEHETRMAGIEDAMLHRVVPGHKLTDNGRQYRGMSLLEIGRDMLEAHGVRTRGLAKLELATRMLTFRSGAMTTSDFANLFANVANKRLRNAYDENAGSYGVWARRAPNAPDFKAMNVIQLSGAPALLQTNEHGEFKYGAMTDGAETYSLLTYGRIVALTRQAIVNDDLRGFDRLVGAFGNSARRLENATVYSQLTANGAMSDGDALFHANHGNLGTGAGSALSLTSLKAMRAAMRVQKGLQSETLNLVPAYLIVPAALEQDAYQYTSTNYVPTKASDVNEFRTGGRTALTPVVEPILDAASATAWYAAAESGQIDTVEYCYLDGADGPVIESDVGFEVDGVSYKCRLDFAAKAVDHRGLYKANGA